MSDCFVERVKGHVEGQCKEQKLEQSTTEKLGNNIKQNKEQNENPNEKKNIKQGKTGTLLEIKNVYKSFKSAQSAQLKVLENISFNLRSDEIVALVGPSGCGKTTVLNIIAGLLTADKGQLNMKDSRIAYIFQETRLLPWKTVENNISFVQENFLSGDEAYQIRESLLYSSGLYDMKGSYPGQLSGGMKQRLEIIRALSIKPYLLLMDEPFKSLDISLKYQLQQMLLTEYNKNKFSIMYVTHDPEDAVLLADRILILSSKPSKIRKIFQINKPREERDLQDKDIYNILQEIIEP